MELILFYKPFQVLSQFSPEGDKRTLASFIQVPGVYPAGRLDYDSEGLLLLTSDGKLQHRITDPRHKWSKTYWVQVEGEPSEHQLEQLSRGVLLKDGMTLPAQTHLIKGEPNLPARIPPIRFRKHVPDQWISLTIREGRNRQVRRMTAAVGLPTLRLVRVQVGPYDLGDLQPGEWKYVDARGSLKAGKP
jgi:23S rRNA pseudouridine2457 synthase